MTDSLALTPVTGERLALKDAQLVYRGCTHEFARVLGQPSPDAVVGATDFALLPRREAREQLVLDSRAIHTGRVDIGVIHLGKCAQPLLIVREPLFSRAGQIQGIDIRLIGDSTKTDDIERLMALVEAGASVPDENSLASLVQLRKALATSGRTLARSQAPPQGQLTAANGDPMLQLRLQGLRFRHFAESSADFFWELDADLRFSYVSPGFPTVFEKPRGQIIGQGHGFLISDARRADTECYWSEHLAVVADHRPFRDFEFRWAGKEGIKSIRYSGMPIFNRAGAFLGYRGTGSDVTEVVKHAETSAYHASHDTLTGLFNRRHFEQAIKELWGAAKTSRNSHAVCFLDMDNFKIVNDTCGHEAGDELLRQLAQLFIALVRQSDTLARIGGDEFGLILRNCSVAEALKLTNQVRHEVEDFQFLWHEHRFTVGVSIGLVLLDDRWESPEVLLRAADSACYLAKNEGRNRVIVHREADGHSSNRRAATRWVEEIGAALSNDRLVLACQEIVPLHDDLPVGRRVEMLMRLRLPSGELVSPPAFLPSAERYGLSAALDERTLDLILAWLHANPGLVEELGTCSMNLASGSFADGDFTQRLLNKIDDSGIDPHKLGFEFTETATIANLSSAASFMQVVSALGCQFNVDSFGAGLSSFSYLRKLPIDCLKIDGLLIKDILEDETQHTLVRSISDISRSMGKRTVAVSIDTAELKAAVQIMGIDFAQGFHVAKPVLASSIG